jgi:UDP-glucose 4-epimerase
MTEAWSGCTVLVTGGLGFIGSNLVAELVRLGARVSIVDRASGEFGGSLRNIATVAEQITLHDADVRDADVMSRIVPGHDVIFCVAGQVSHPNSMTDPLLDLDTNCRAHLALLEICRHSNPNVRLVFASTRQVYGRPVTRPVDEQHPLRPVDVNGISKLAAEHFFRLYSEIYGIRSISLRLTNTYGPRMDLRSPGRGFINVCLAQALRGDTITLFGTGEQLRDFTYVADTVEALLLAAQQESGWGSAFNLAHPAPCGLRDFVSVLGTLIDVRVQVVPFPPERLAIDVGDYSGCSRRFQDLTGWMARTSLETGLRKTIDYFLRSETSGNETGWQSSALPRS